MLGADVTMHHHYLAKKLVAMNASEDTITNGRFFPRAAGNGAAPTRFARLTLCPGARTDVVEGLRPDEVVILRCLFEGAVPLDCPKRGLARRSSFRPLASGQIRNATIAPGADELVDSAMRRLPRIPQLLFTACMMDITSPTTNSNTWYTNKVHQ